MQNCFCVKIIVGKEKVGSQLIAGAGLLLNAAQVGAQRNAMQLDLP